MPADEILVLRGQGNVDVQPGGPGNAWKYLSSCASMSGPTVPLGATEIRWCQDPNESNAFQISSQFRTNPDQVSGDLMTKLGKINYLKGLDKCGFGIRARYACSGTRTDPSNYDPLMLEYCSAKLQEYSYEDLVITDPANQDEILQTAPWLALYETRIKKLTAARTGSGTSLSDQAINDIEICDTPSCGDGCAVSSDGCSTIYAVTDADTAPYAAPSLITGTIVDGVLTWTFDPILGINGNVNAVECAGSTLVIASNADSAVAYNTTPSDQDTWNVIPLTYAPAPYHAALHMRTAREGYVGCASGRIYKTVDGARTWTLVHDGDQTTQQINAVWAANAELVYAGGNNGVLLRSDDAGKTWTNVTQTNVTSANILKVVVPINRSLEVYIGTNDGMIYRSKNKGASLAAIAFSGDGVGTIDDLVFAGKCGDVLLILQNDAGPRGRLLRDLSGGAGGADVETVFEYTGIIAGGVQLNSLAVCDANSLYVAGELNGGYPVVISVD